MGSVIIAVSLLLTVYSMYRQSRRIGRWYWWGFLAILGAMALFILCFIVPLVGSEFFEKRPELLVALMLGGILIFVAASIYVARRWSIKMVQAGATAAAPEPASSDRKSPAGNKA